MGTHSYYMDVFRKTKEEKPPTINSLGFHRFSRCATGDFSEIEEVADIPTMDERRYMELFTCRELLLNESYIWQPVFENPVHNYMVGIRCHGELYHEISLLMSRDKDSRKKLKTVLEDIFGIKLELRHGILTEDVARRTFGNYRISYADGTKECLGYVTLYLSSIENVGVSTIDCGVSAILALLKESRIINGILSGEITDRKSLCVALVRIAMDRANKTDDSYNCFSLLGITYNTSSTMTEVKSRIREALSVRSNDDGSDWFSITNLAVFCYVFRSLQGYSVYSGEGGPSSFIMEHSSRKLFSEFRDFLNENEILRFLREHVLDIAGYFSDNEDEDFYDDYEDDSEESSTAERMANAWASA